MAHRIAYAIAILALCSPAFGQIDPKAEPFLDFTDMVQKSAIPMRTADYTLCSTSYGSDETEGEMCTRIMDFANRRMMSQTTSSKGDEAMTFKMVYANGQATMTDAFSEEPTALPKDQVAILERSFDYAADVVETGGALPDEVLSATYDGDVRYGEASAGSRSQPA